MKKIGFSILIGLLMLAFNVSLVFAAPPLSLQIVVQETIAGGSETFQASGSAVSTGLICSTGSVVEVGLPSSNNPGGPFQMLWITKEFDCGSGHVFYVEMVVKLDLNSGFTTANWKITGGTDKYVNLKGNGKLNGTPVPGLEGVEITDVYVGKVH